MSLAPNLTEIVCAVGACDRLVGRTAYCNFPASVTRIEVTGDLQSPLYERIVALRPDVVLMSTAGNISAAHSKLRDLGVPVVVVGAERIAGVLKGIEVVGSIVGREREAKRLVDSLRLGIDSLKRRADQQPAVRTFVVVGASPLVSVRSGFLAESLAIAGGENIVGESVADYPTVGREEVVRADPEVIIVPGSQADADGLLQLYPEWRQLSAVRAGRVIALPPDILFRPGPRLLESIRLLYIALHP